MDIDLKLVLIAFLIGFALYLLVNRVFMVEGVTDNACSVDNCNKQCHPDEPCFCDNTCPGLGCNVRNIDKCRFCGFGNYSDIDCGGPSNPSPPPSNPSPSPPPSTPSPPPSNPSPPPSPSPSGECVCTIPFISENPLACRDVGNNPNNPKPNIEKTVCTLRRTPEDCENIIGHQNVTKGTCKWETSPPTPPPSGECVCTWPFISENPLACRDVGNNPNNPKPNIKKTVCTLRRTPEDCENRIGHQNVTRGTCKWETSSPSPQK